MHLWILRFLMIIFDWPVLQVHKQQMTEKKKSTRNLLWPISYSGCKYVQRMTNFLLLRQKDLEHSNIPSYFCSAIHHGLSLRSNSFFWIGVSDHESEGNFVWINGDRASVTDEDLWHNVEFNNGEISDCCISRFDTMQSDVRVSSCFILFPGICEKRV